VHIPRGTYNQELRIGIKTPMSTRRPISAE
jgi:hypothetical protein